MLYLSTNVSEWIVNTINNNNISIDSRWDIVSKDKDDVKLKQVNKKYYCWTFVLSIDYCQNSFVSKEQGVFVGVIVW